MLLSLVTPDSDQMILDIFRDYMNRNNLSSFYSNKGRFDTHTDKTNVALDDELNLVISLFTHEYPHVCFFFCFFVKLSWY